MDWHAPRSTVPSAARSHGARPLGHASSGRCVMPPHELQPAGVGLRDISGFRNVRQGGFVKASVAACPVGGVPRRPGFIRRVLSRVSTLPPPPSTRRFLDAPRGRMTSSRSRSTAAANSWLGFEDACARLASPSSCWRPDAPVQCGIERAKWHRPTEFRSQYAGERPCPPSTRRSMPTSTAATALPPPLRHWHGDPTAHFATWRRLSDVRDVLNSHNG